MWHCVIPVRCNEDFRPWLMTICTLEPTPAAKISQKARRRSAGRIWNRNKKSVCEVCKRTGQEARDLARLVARVVLHVQTETASDCNNANTARRPFSCGNWQ